MRKYMFHHHRQSVFVKEILCLSHTVCVHQRWSVCVTDNLYLSHIVCVSHWQSASVFNTLSEFFLAYILTNYTKFLSKSPPDVYVCWYTLGARSMTAWCNLSALSMHLNIQCTCTLRVHLHTQCTFILHARSVNRACMEGAGSVYRACNNDDI